VALLQLAAPLSVRFEAARFRVSLRLARPQHIP